MKYLLYLFTPLLLSACGSDDSKTNQEGTTFPSDSTVVVGYRNPVIRISTPDPTAIRVDDGTYYLYATEDIHNLPIFKSKDMVHWEEIGTAFTDATRPNFVVTIPKGRRRLSGLPKSGISKENMCCSIRWLNGVIIGSVP